MTIEVLYSCGKCGLVRCKVNVPAREDEPVVTWMQGLGVILSRDHDMRSPGCHPETLSEVRIPIEGANKIGGPVLQ